MAGILESQPDEAYNCVDDVDGPAWYRENRLLPDERPQLTDNSDVRFLPIRGWVRLLLLALVSLVPLLLTSLCSIELYFVLVLALDWNQYSGWPIVAATELIYKDESG